MVCNGFVVETITISVMVSIVFFSRVVLKNYYQDLQTRRVVDRAE